MGHSTLRLEEHFRGTVVEKGVLPVLWSENDFVGRNRVIGNVAKKRNSYVARKSAIGVEEASSSNISQALKDHINFLEIDRAWRVEVAFWQGCIGDAASTRLHRAILGCLPMLQQLVSPQQAVTKLDVAESKFWKVCGASLRSTFQTVAQFVKAIAANSPLAIDKLIDGSSMASVKLRFTDLCPWSNSAASAPDAKPSVGEDAAEARLARVVKLHLGLPGGRSLAVVVVRVAHVTSIRRQRR